MYLSKTDSKEIVETIRKMEVKDDEVVLILLGEKNKPDIPRMISGLNRDRINFFGGIFPGIIHDDRKYEEGAIITVLPALEKPFLIKGLDTEKIGIPDFGEKVPGDSDKKYTAIILVDGLTANIALFLAGMFNQLGNSVHYFGGGAGSLSFKQSPCIFSPEGFVRDAAVVTFVKLESSLGVRHGWERIMGPSRPGGPIVASKTHKNIVAELNWENAFEVYKKTVEGDSGRKLTTEKFYDLAMEYPFGIYKEGAEDIVRDPFAANEKGELICVGEVPENTVLSILKGTKPSLIQAAGQAADDSQKLEGKKICCTLVADCISRVLFLGEDFVRELETVKKKIRVIDKECVPEGILTIGEISSYGEGLLEFFNKTIVVGVLYE